MALSLVFILLKNAIDYRLYIQYHHHRQSGLPQGRSFTTSAGTQAAVLPTGRSSTANSGTQAAVLPGIELVRQLPVAFHTPLSLPSEQILKDLKRSQGHHVEVRRVDLANWALRTSPKFITGFLTRSLMYILS